ncbi:hypothetical protein N7494_004482 [Penicillium frequentans]|uniref:Uncharacterized protein n=1 Tax=Penicillium frequentans TaxID=3151616 RepID=A0AAD6GHC4_9EURO|nr:hypothetical protein N7494_004482 [Penicillium glabrum]
MPSDQENFCVLEIRPDVKLRVTTIAIAITAPGLITGTVTTIPTCENGSYYYSNPNGSTYYNNGKGYSIYTPPSSSSSGSGSGFSSGSTQK